MFELNEESNVERPQIGDKAILVSINFNDINYHENTEELRQLSISAGFEVSEVVTSKRQTPDARLFIGSGKAEELLLIKDATEATTIIFNHELTPSQERNLEKLLGLRVYDRTALILYIFAQRAK